MLSWDGRVAERDTRVEEGWEGGQPAKEKTKPSKKLHNFLLLRKQAGELRWTEHFGGKTTSDFIILFSGGEDMRRHTCTHGRLQEL